MTPEEFEARVDKAFETLPTPEAVIKWAKEHNFTFKCGTLGDASCGCALTAVALMGYPKVFEEGTAIDWSAYADISTPTEAVHDVLYGQLGDRTNNSIQRGIWRGFDNISFWESDEAAYDFGRKLRQLAEENELLRRGN